MEAAGEQAEMPTQDPPLDDAQPRPDPAQTGGQTLAPAGGRVDPIPSKKTSKVSWMAPAIAVNLVVLIVVIALLCVYASFQDARSDGSAINPVDKWLIAFAVIIGLAILNMILITLIYAIFRSRKYEVLDWLLLTLVPVVLGIAAWAVLAAALGTPMA